MRWYCACALQSYDLIAFYVAQRSVKSQLLYQLSYAPHRRAGSISKARPLVESSSGPSLLPALALSAGSTNLGQIVGRTLADPAAALSPGHLLAFAALFVVMLAETGRLPVDNPATHLELTMIHEAMVLEYSGRYLALIEWAAALKLLVFFALLGNLFVPWGVAAVAAPAALALALGSLLLKLAVIAVVVAVLETRVAKLRLFRVPELLSVSFVLALLAVTSSFLGR